MKNMILVCLLGGIGLISTPFTSFSQIKKPLINHIALYVQDLAKSTFFYRDIVGLDTVPEPFHDGKHTWLSIGGGGNLHLIKGAGAIIPQNKNSHLCFSVPSMEDFIARLDKHGIYYESWAGDSKTQTVRVDGVRQIYFKDPDGYWLEINNDYK